MTFSVYEPSAPNVNPMMTLAAESVNTQDPTIPLVAFGDWQTLVLDVPVVPPVAPASPGETGPKACAMKEPPFIEQPVVTIRFAAGGEQVFSEKVTHVVGLHRLRVPLAIENVSLATA